MTPPLPDSDFEPAQPPRRLPAWAGWRSPSWALYGLGALVLAGVVLRVVASVAWWPTIPTLADAWPYAYYAGAETLIDPQHPAGYSLFLAVAGFFTHSVGLFTVLQHGLGIASALILFSATRRLCGSPWPGLLGAAFILLGADQIFLEGTIMSETLFTFLFVASLYAIARALEEPSRWWPWAGAAGVLIALASVVRTAGLFLVPLLLLALLLSRPRPWLPRWKPVAGFLAAAVAVLLCYATANALDHGDFEVAPSPGWRLYVRVAPFAECDEFTPPRGTAQLCESTPPDERLGPDWYFYSPDSPATKLFGSFGETRGAGDEKLGAFARQVVLHQPLDYLDAVASDDLDYFFPDRFEYVEGAGSDLDGQLDWTRPRSLQIERETQAGMEAFFDPFTVSRSSGALAFLHDYQRVFRFGGLALTIATLLILAGLLVGPRRDRIAVLVLGVGGLVTFALPTFSLLYIGRYTVPSAGPMVAGAALAAISLARSPAIRRQLRRLSAARSPSPSA